MYTIHSAKTHEIKYTKIKAQRGLMNHPVSPFQHWMFLCLSFLSSSRSLLNPFCFCEWFFHNNKEWQWYVSTTSREKNVSTLLQIEIFYTPKTWNANNMNVTLQKHIKLTSKTKLNIEHATVTRCKLESSNNLRFNNKYKNNVFSETSKDGHGANCCKVRTKSSSLPTSIQNKKIINLV